MTALTEDRNTPLADTQLLSLPVAGGARIFAGSLVVLGLGFARPGHDAPDLVAMGRAEQFVDNREGGDGDERVLVRHGLAFRWASDGTVTAAHLGQLAYVIDDQTVSADDNGGKRSLAGRIIQLEAGEVWVH
ncbi:hypothetical protein [Pseudomonas aeruginosa]|uniref:hypothetical protein n=2 Tax=Pseudomonas aeruginosa TaxID=287 RepID=UPI000BB6CB8B|nr:hypothetical protein [Pseudomonas aeruginosa]AXR09996.1 hypothetical protein DZ899_07340 [Pseudomonas aeruginosa]EIU2598535.1 hypothetical protein [Pseudomonas aeruginosa]EIU2879835.1 hypothetical protein [Pseudomonas aeruginosa]ELC7283652.1 hypothetical protein [Pseudomonas aeruginosa]ELK4865876.1 hypothetical protein [Pseudomonas aeruginosa]